MSNQKILIVDDEPFNIDYLEQELDELNYATISASNGQEALDQIVEESPDLILLDIMMPVMDGFEVLKRLKNDPDACNIPVIVISANNDLQSVVKGIQTGSRRLPSQAFRTHTFACPYQLMSGEKTIT